MFETTKFQFSFPYQTTWLLIIIDNPYPFTVGQGFPCRFKWEKSHGSPHENPSLQNIYITLKRP